MIRSGLGLFSPGAEDAKTNPVITKILNGSKIRVIDGPVCKDNAYWWLVSTESSSGQPVGWTEEVELGQGYFIKYGLNK